MDERLLKWRGRKVLITGFSGFVGTALARALLELGAEVTGLVSDLNKNRDDDLWDQCNLVFGDVCDFDVVRRAVSFYEIDTVFHFAAFAIVRVAARDPVSAYAVNVMGTVNVLEACRQAGTLKSVVVASSDKAYGDHDILPYTEDHPLQPRNTYDTSKACMDMIGRSYACNYDMPVVVTRCSNIYGPGDMNLSRIIPNSIKRVLDNKSPYLFRDVEQMEREFIFIDDVVDAYLLIGLEPYDLKGHAFNIGGDQPIKIGDLATKITHLMARPDLQPVVVSRENVFREIGKQCIDASKLKVTHGWMRSVDLNEGLKRTIKWYANFFHRADLIPNIWKTKRELEGTSDENILGDATRKLIDDMFKAKP